MMKGMSLASLKSHPSLIPLFGFVALGSGIATWYVWRLATKCPDVAWTRSNPEPWQVYATKKYKLVDAGHDNVDVQKPPEF